MDNNNDKLQMFIDAVNDEVDGKVNRILAEAEEKKNEILAGAEENYGGNKVRNSVSGISKNGSKYVRDISKAELEMKKSVIRHRDELSAKVFSAVENKLREYRSDPKYVDMLIKDLLLMHVSDSSEIFLSPDDMRFAETLKKAVPSCKAKFSSDEKIRLGGLYVYNSENNTIIDKTFDSALEEQKRTFVNGNVFARQSE